MRDRDWRTIWAFKDRLPRESHYKSALAMDSELAAAVLDAEQADEDSDDEDADEPVVTPVGYSLDTYLLLALIDAVMGVQAAVIAAAGADPPQIKPMPRPQTATDLLREQRRLESLNELVALFTPVTDPGEH